MTTAVWYGPRGSNRLATYLLYPLLVSTHFREFRFARDLSDLLRLGRERKTHAAVLLGNASELLRSRQLTLDELDKVREEYARVAFFDATPNPLQIDKEVLARVDVYFKSTVYHDLKVYLRPIVGGTVWSDWFHRNVQPLDLPAVSTGLEARNLVKLRSAWNIGYGLYPRSSVTKRLPPLLERWPGPRVSTWLRPKVPRFLGESKRRPGIHARMTTTGQGEAMRVHREHFIHKASVIPTALIGKTSRREYQSELRSVTSVLSPFGLGEPCYRDFEAVQCGAVLLKPAMTHVKTWPNVYSQSDSIPLAWDGSDIAEAYVRALDPEFSRSLTKSAYGRFSEAYRDLEKYVESFMSEVYGHNGSYEI